MKSKTIHCGLSIAVVLQYGVLAASAQATQYLYTGSETNVTLNPGTYIITAYGAPGGVVVGPASYGAEMSAEFNFSTSTNLTLLVGGGGGGGGSFVVEGSTPLVVAGGGGGDGCSDQFQVNDSGENGNISTTGNGFEIVRGISRLPSGTGVGGANGAGGAGGFDPSPNQFDVIDIGGGGGFLGNGANGFQYENNPYAPGFGGAGGSSYFGGGGGGLSEDFNFTGEYLLAGDGSYGGGGGGSGLGDEGGAGGGGYSGGGGGAENDGFEDGGGGSIIDSSAIATLAEVSGVSSPDDPYNGEIIITNEVPEPTSASMLAIGSLALLRRRVRRSHVESAKLGQSSSLRGSARFR